MSINFEEDKIDSLANAKTNDIKQLSQQVLKLRDLEDKLALKEKELKKLKGDMDVLSGEVIPTMMTEMNISKFSLADGAGVECKPVYVLQFLSQRKKKHLTGFVTTAWVILLKMRLLFPLVVTRITRQQNMLALHKVKDINQSRS